MAKNDHARMQKEVDNQSNNLIYGYGGSAGTPGTYTNTRGRNGMSNSIYTPGTAPTMGTGGALNLYNNMFGSGAGQGGTSYDEIMNAYRGFTNSGDMNASRSAYSDLAGGGVNAQAMREAAMNQYRAVYANANRNLNRQRSLQGGYSPGYTTALTRMAREQGQGSADAANAAEASIQDLISRNKTAGASGLAGLAQMGLSANNAMGNMLNEHNQQLQGYQGLQNQIAQLLMGGRAQTAQIPGNFGTIMGDIGSVLGLGSQVISPFASLFGPRTPGNFINVNPSQLPLGPSAGAGVTL